jgi:hypothetical protein
MKQRITNDYFTALVNRSRRAGYKRNRQLLEAHGLDGIEAGIAFSTPKGAIVVTDVEYVDGRKMVSYDSISRSDLKVRSCRCAEGTLLWNNPDLAIMRF